MFWYRPRLLVNFYFPTFRSAEIPMRGASARHVDEYVATVWDQLRAALHEARAQSVAEAQRQKWYCNQKIGTMDLKPGNLVLVKAYAFKGKRKIKDRWEDEPHEVVHQVATDVPSYKVTNQHRQSQIFHCNQLLLVMSKAGIPLCVGVCQAWDQCTRPTPVKPTPKVSDNRYMPQVDSGLAITQHQASMTSLGKINGKLWLLLWTPTRASTEDGWRPQVMLSGCGGPKDHVPLAKGVDVSSPSIPLDS